MAVPANPAGTAEQSARSGGPEGPRGSQRSRSAVVMSSREDRAEEVCAVGRRCPVIQGPEAKP